MYGSLWSCTTRFYTTKERLGFSSEVIALRGVSKSWGSGFFFPIFLRGSNFFKVSGSNLQLHSIGKIFDHIYCVRNLGQKFDHNPKSDSIKLEYCVQICPTFSGFNLFYSSLEIFLNLRKIFAYSSYCYILFQDIISINRWPLKPYLSF